MKELFEPFLPSSKYNLQGKITTDHNWHIKQNIEHDLYERTPQIKSNVIFSKKNVGWKSNAYKS